MTAFQSRVLAALRRKPLTGTGVAMAVNGSAPLVHRTLDALYRRSLVTILDDGRWAITDRGRKKVAA